MKEWILTAVGTNKPFEAYWSKRIVALDMTGKCIFATQFESNTEARKLGWFKKYETCLVQGTLTFIKINLD